MIKEREKFTQSVNKALGHSFTCEDFKNDLELEDLEHQPVHELYADDDDGAAFTIPEADHDADADTYDQYAGAEVILPIGDSMMNAKVRKRKRELDGSLLGKANFNPILDTRTYEVEFADGQTAELTANVIAHNMYAHCDGEGNQYLLFAGILDHRKDSSVVERPDMVITRGSNQHYRKTTKGWGLCIEWKDGSTSWKKLSNPVEVADYAVAHGIENETAFALWVPFTIKH